MTLYVNKKRIGLKWVIAVIVFILAMTVTFADVHGLGIPSFSRLNPPSSSQSGQMGPSGTPTGGNYGNLDYAHEPAATTTDDTPDDNPPVSVPEPTTLVLLGCGLGALAVAMRMKS